MEQFLILYTIFLQHTYGQCCLILYLLIGEIIVVLLFGVRRLAGTLSSNVAATKILTLVS